MLYETPSKKKLELVNDKERGHVIVYTKTDVEKVFDSALSGSYKIENPNEYVINAKVGNKIVLRYDKSSATGKNYFMVYDINEVNKAYKILEKIGFPLSEAEFKTHIKESHNVSNQRPPPCRIYLAYII